MNKNKTCIILGSNSDIGQAVAYEFAKNGFDIILASRNIDQYQQRLNFDISLKYNVKVYNTQFDGSLYLSHFNFWNDLPVLPDILVSVFGYLGDQKIAMSDFNETNKIYGSNVLGQISLINSYLHVINNFSKTCDAIIGISSVAGDRGRKSNFIYGSAKSAFSTYLSGLRNDLYKSGVNVITVKPGFVKTKMLGDLITPSFLTATPEIVAIKVFNAFKNKKDCIYVYGIWRLVMLIIRNIPEFIFKKLNL